MTARAQRREWTSPRFTLGDAEAASAEWGFNCGPAALCAVTGKTPEEIRPYLGDFESKRYTNPTLMWDVLCRLGVRWHRYCGNGVRWPDFGLARVQWAGPWTDDGVPIRARYRHTHWVAHYGGVYSCGVFDVNCLNSGGWVSRRDWERIIVPAILEACEPKASGRWWLTHSVEVQP